MSRIKFFYQDLQPLKLNNKHIIEKIRFLIKKESKKSGNISIIFCSDKYLLDINVEYLQHTYYTDIITFNYVIEDLISGDLFISIDRVKENAQYYKTSFLKELYRVIFHGVLHLTGYNDKTTNEKKIMREKEDYYLSEVDFRELEK